MSHIFYIGELVVLYENNPQKDVGILLSAKLMPMKYAPTKEPLLSYGPISRTSGIGYGEWLECIKALDMEPLFSTDRDCFDDNGEIVTSLMTHWAPCGVSPLTKTHAKYIKQKMAEFRKKNPGVPAFEKGTELECFHLYGSWLEYWIPKAVAALKRPVFRVG